jgi:hypothetical protein
LQQLRSFGLEPEIQKTTAVNSTGAPLFLAGTIENIVARRKGSGDGRAVALVAHYDSVSTGPGANDDGVAVATLLETARALTAGPQLRNDVLFLFTDGEETGLLGARAFVAEHAWAKEVEIALNFEARGNGGPSVMFETSPQNGALIRALAKATSHPLANSLSYEIYKRLPNSSDFTVFKEAGWPGMNFAYINGLTHYHTQLDSRENVDSRSLQHHGSYALALSRYFGAAVPAAAQEGDAIYFDAVGFMLVRYPAWLAGPFAFGVLLVFAAVIWLGFRRGKLTGPGIAKGALLFFLSLVAAAVVVAGAWWLIRQIHSGLQHDHAGGQLQPRALRDRVCYPDARLHRGYCGLVRKTDRQRRSLRGRAPVVGRGDDRDHHLDGGQQLSSDMAFVLCPARPGLRVRWTGRERSTGR